MRCEHLKIKDSNNIYSPMFAEVTTDSSLSLAQTQSLRRHSDNFPAVFRKMGTLGKYPSATERLTPRRYRGFRWQPVFAAKCFESIFSFSSEYSSHALHRDVIVGYMLSRTCSESLLQDQTAVRYVVSRFCLGPGNRSVRSQCVRTLPRP